jgi:hypothetical protein
LSASFQLYVLAPLTLLILIRRPKIGIPLNIFVIILGIFLNVYPRIFLNIPVYFEFQKIKTITSMLMSIDYYIFNTMQYVSSFTLGMLSGYFVMNQPKFDIGGSNVQNVLNILALILISCAIYWSSALLNINQIHLEINVLLYLTFGKFIWSLSNAWILFVCCTGRSGKGKAQIYKIN